MEYTLAAYDLPPRVGGAARYHAAVAQALGASCAIREMEPARHWMRHLPDFLRLHRDTHCIVGELLPVGTLAWLRMRHQGSPYSVICHGLDLARAAQHPRKRLLARMILRGASRVIANSAHTAQRIASLAGPDARITIVPPPIGITPEHTNTLAIRAVRERAGVGDVPVVLSAGRLVQRKGFDTLLEAMALVQRHVPGVRLVIVGNGPEDRALRQHAERLRVPAAFIDAADDAELAAWYGACDLFAMLPRELSDGDVEGFGIVYLEANGFGKPVVGTRSGGVPDAIAHGISGFLVPPDRPHAAAARITRLLLRPDVAAAVGQRGYARVQEEFSRERFDQRIRDALAEKFEARISKHETITA